MPDKSYIITGGAHIDDRGKVGFVNLFDPEAAGIVRVYLVENHQRGFVRAWHGHMRESKWVMCVSGAALVCTVPLVDDGFGCWDEKQPVSRFVLSADRPDVLYIPNEHANGFMSFTDDCKLMFFSNRSTVESNADDLRIEARTWDPWKVEWR